jgi:hydrogenase maturation protease
MGRTLILGLGNPILSDDAVGIRIVETIEEIIGEIEGVDYVTGSISGMSFLDCIQGYDKLVLVDAVERGAPPGTLHYISLDELVRTLHFTSVHSLNLATAIELGRRAGMKIPPCISIYGVEVGNIIDFSMKMTAQVEKSVFTNAETIIEREFERSAG